MVWRNMHRAGCRKRERIAVLKQKQPIITAIETGYFIADKAKQQLRRAAWRAQHANRPSNHNIETIDLTQELDKTPNPEHAKSTKPPFTPTNYMIKVLQFFNEIEQYLLSIRYIKKTYT